MDTASAVRAAYTAGRAFARLRQLVSILARLWRSEIILFVRLACLSASDAASTDFRHHLTLTHTQQPAISGKRGKEKSLIYAGFANLCKAQQPLTAHS